jgi:hypothetical protein
VIAPEFVCPGCGAADPACGMIDLGIGYYEYWGAPGYDVDEHWLTKCCEAVPEPFWPEPVEPDENLIPAGSVA